MSATRGRILVIRGGAIGDFVLTLPAIAALRSQFPETHLEILGYPHITQLALAGGWVDAVRPIEAKGLAGFFARNGRLDASIAGYLAGFDLIVSYLFDPDDIFKTNVAACSQAQIIQCPHRPAEAESVHATAVYLRALEQLAIFDADPVPRLKFSGTTGNQSTLTLHPGSGSERKNWPEARWSELIRRLLAETDYRLLIVGGEAEGGRVDRLTAQLPEGRVDVARSWALVDLAKRMHGCLAFVGHDSGITHIAAALGLPCVVLWADTNQTIWCPQGEHIVILNEPRGLRALDVDWVFREACKLAVGNQGPV